MNRILILFAHPALENSRAQRRMLEAARGLEGVTVHDLYEEYPDFGIDVRREQALLLEHDVLIFQHPLYWYSTPALLKQWQDLVLEHGWAYGTGGTNLRGKWFLSAITAGGPGTAYARSGYNRFTLRELLAPIEQTARLCGVSFLPPFVVLDAHSLDDDALAAAGRRYRTLLEALRDRPLAGLEFTSDALFDVDTMLTHWNET